MAARVRLAILTSCAFALVPACARADTQTEVGVLAAFIAGSHVGSENPIPVSGVVPGAALEFQERVDRFRVHLEGIPTVGASGATVGAFGRSSATLSLLNATALVDIGRAHRVRVGTGFQLVNLDNVNGTNGDRNQVRIASITYAAGATLPLARGRFVDLDLNVDPNLRGILHVFDRTGLAKPDKPEAGAEIDYAVAYGWRKHDVEYRLGVRALSYHTRNVLTGDLVDRNVGGGATFDVRFAFGKS